MTGHQEVTRIARLQRSIHGISVGGDEFPRLARKHLTTQHGYLFEVPARPRQDVELAVDGLRSRFRSLDEEVLLHVDTTERSASSQKKKEQSTYRTKDANSAFRPFQKVQFSDRVIRSFYSIFYTNTVDANTSSELPEKRPPHFCTTPRKCAGQVLELSS